MKELSIPNFDMKIGTLKNNLIKTLEENFKTYWHKLKTTTQETKQGKLSTYFTFKNCFERESYLNVRHFKIRQVICKLRISAHPLRIECGRYKNIQRSDRICLYCSQGKVEDEQHFISECSLYENIRNQLYLKITKLCQNFPTLNNSAKVIWLFLQRRQ